MQCLFLYIYLCMDVVILQHMHKCIHVFIYISVCIYISFSKYISQSTYLPTYLSISLPIYIQYECDRIHSRQAPQAKLSPLTTRAAAATQPVLGRCFWRRSALRVASLPTLAANAPAQTGKHQRKTARYRNL